jgi:DNA polymerase I-like protein with 3'-5' exonuclease and polymerase domains
MQTGWTHEVLKNKFQVSPLGMRYYWPDTQMTRSGYITNTTSIFNYVVQGSATAEIIPIVLVWLWYAVRDLRVRLILTVHDSVILEVHKDDVETLKPIIAQCFTNCVYRTLRDLYGYEWRSVPLACEIKFGTHWSEGKGETASVDPNNKRVVTWKTK